MPDVPTIAESGLPGYEFTAWYGMLAPKGTPKMIVALLNGKLQRSMRSADLSQRFEQEGADIVASSAEDFSKHLKNELDKWSKVIKERRMHAD